MLDAVVQTLRPAFEAAVAIMAAAALAVRFAPQDRRPLTGVWFSAALAVAGAAALSVGLSADRLDPRSVDAVLGTAAFAGMLVVLAGLVVPRMPARVAVVSAAVATLAMLLPRGVALAPLTRHLHGALALEVEAVTALVGSALGLSLGALSVVVLVRAVRRSERGRRVFAAVPLVALIVLQTAEVVRSAFTFGLLPMTPALVGLLAPLMNATDTLLYALAGAVASAAVWRLVRRPARPDVPPANPAQVRLLRAGLRSERRAALFALAAAVLPVALVAGQAAAIAHEKAASELTKAEELQPEGGHVSVPMERVADGRMHRFSVKVDGSEVRFIVVHKGSGLYGTGLDACEICGPTGYFQRGKDVVCKACDVVIPIPTIGFTGGCNPVPLKYEKREGRLVFDMAELRAGVGEFE